MNLLYAIFLTLILTANSEEEKEPVIDDEFCNKKLAEYKQKVPNIIIVSQSRSNRIYLFYIGIFNYKSIMFLSHSTILKIYQLTAIRIIFYKFLVSNNNI